MSRIVSALVAILCAATAHAQPSGELIERTLAIVGGQAITLSDVRAALALGLVDNETPTDPIGPATQRLIERALILREVQRYAPSEPSDAAIDARIATMTSRFATAEALRAAIVSVGFSDAQLRAWARDDLRIASYLDQRFTAAGSPERRAELVRDWIVDIRRRTIVVELKP